MIETMNGLTERTNFVRIDLGKQGKQKKQGEQCCSSFFHINTWLEVLTVTKEIQEYQVHKNKKYLVLKIPLDCYKKS